MTQRAASADRLGEALWVGAATGLLADTYFLVARAGWCVGAPVGLFWPLVAGAGLAAIVVLGLRAIRPCDAGTAALLVVAAAFVLATVVLNLVPPIARDELSYHLAFPALYARSGRVHEIPFAMQSYYPMLVDMFYVPLVAQGWANGAKYVHLLFAMATGGLVLLYLRPRVPAWLATFAAVLLLTTPTVTALAASAYVDLGLLFYATVGLLGLLRWSETGRRSDFIAGALGAGCAASTKYNGFLLVALLSAVALLLSEGRGARRAIRAAIAFGALSLIPLLPWLLNNLAATGNPVYPVARQFLGGPPLLEKANDTVFLYRRVLYGESWIQVMTTPVRVFLTGREGDPARFDGVFNPLYLLGVLAALWPGASRRRVAFAGLAVCFLWLEFFLQVFRSRYSIPVLVPLAVLLAETIDRWRQDRRLASPGVVVLCAGALLFNVAHFVLFWQRIDPLAYVLERQSRTDYITRFVPEYPVTVYANSHLPREATVYLAFLGERAYYWQTNYSFDTHAPGLTLRQAVRGAADAGAVAAALRGRGITHIAAFDPLLARSMRDNLADAEHQRWEQFVRTRLKLLYANRGAGLYEIS